MPGGPHPHLGLPCKVRALTDSFIPTTQYVARATQYVHTHLILLQLRLPSSGSCALCTLPHDLLYPQAGPSWLASWLSRALLAMLCTRTSGSGACFEDRRLNTSMPSEVCTSNEPGRPSPCSFPSTTTEGNAASIASAAAMNTSTSSGSYSMVTVLGGARPRPADHAMWRAPEVGPDTLGVEKKGVGKVRGMKPAWAAVLARLVPAVLR
mmetsp:Transcript_6805/g.15065  ORF Transcript_6805/g.15065 Transcript_6805/m.15065 type:complete len:209 (-) Transcript_6805:263-889(-)